MDYKLGSYNHEWGFIGGQLGNVNYPEYIDADAKYVVVTERDNHRLQVFTNFGEVSQYKLLGSPGKGFNKLRYPAGVITTPISNGQIVVADSGNMRINYYGLRSDKHGYGEINQMHTFGSLVFSKPMGLGYDEKHNTLLVTDPGRQRITLHDFTNQQLLRVVEVKNSLIPMRAPYDITLDNLGRMFVTDHESNAVFCFEANGKHLFTFGENDLQQPWGICFDKRKQVLYVSDKGNGRVLKYSTDGTILKEMSNFMRPKGLAVNAHGNLVVATEDPLAFLKLVGFQSLV